MNVNKSHVVSVKIVIFHVVVVMVVVVGDVVVGVDIGVVGVGVVGEEEVFDVVVVVVESSCCHWSRLAFLCDCVICNQTIG